MLFRSAYPNQTRIPGGAPGGTTTDIATFTMPDAGDFARNHHYVVYAYFTPSGRLTLSVSVLQWELHRLVTSYEYNPGGTEGVLPLAGTYREIDNTTHTVLMRYQTPLVLLFRIASPEGFAWTARINSQKGNPLAFKFRDPATNQLVERITGTIGPGEEIPQKNNEVWHKLVVEPVTWNASIENTATIEIVARNMFGKTVPLMPDMLTRWTIVQRATE